MANSNLDTLSKWDENERKNWLVDIKFSIWNISKSSVESFCKSTLAILEADAKWNYTEITKL